MSTAEPDRQAGQQEPDPKAAIPPAQRRRDRHGRRDRAPAANNTTGPRSTTRPSKTVGSRRAGHSESLNVELPEIDPTITPTAARALLRLILNVAKQKRLDLPNLSPPE